MKGDAVAGVIVAGCLVAAFLVYSHASITVTQTPAPIAALASPSAPTPAPTPTPAADPFAPARWAAVNVALIALVLAIGIGVPVGIALHAWHRGRLAELDHPPLRRPEFVHRAYDVKSLEARRGWLPESFTYSPHLRQDTAEVVEESPQLNGPLPSAEALVAMPGLAYGVRVDNGEPLIDDEIRSLLVGGQMGQGKSTLVALLGAQLYQMGARLVVGDPHASNPQGLSARMRTLIDRFELEQEPRLIFHRVMEAWNELERRERLGDPRGLPPYVVIVDEFAELLRRLNDRDEERLRDALLLIGGLSGRKFKVATIVMSQSWKHSVVRSTEMRDLVSTQAVFRMRKDEALRMTNLGSDYWNPDPLLLQKGEAFIVGVLSGAVLVRVPPVEAPTRAPAREALSPNRTPGVLPNRTMGVLSEAEGTPQRTVDGQWVDTSKDSGEDTSEDTSRDSDILASFRRSGDVNATVREVFDVRPGGEAWQRARRRVNGALQRALR